MVEEMVSSKGRKKITTTCFLRKGEEATKTAIKRIPHLTPPPPKMPPIWHMLPSVLGGRKLPAQMPPRQKKKGKIEIASSLAQQREKVI